MKIHQEEPPRQIRRKQYVTKFSGEPAMEKFVALFACALPGPCLHDGHLIHRYCFCGDRHLCRRPLGRTEIVHARDGDP